MGKVKPAEEVGKVRMQGKKKTIGEEKSGQRGGSKNVKLVGLVKEADGKR